MPSKSVRSFRKSGMAKNDGGIPQQGVNPSFNSTYPSIKVDMQVAGEAPINVEYKERLPIAPTPIGSVDLGEVSLGGKKS